MPPHLSPSSSLTCGVPQGSVLSPILFNLYKTPLSTLISSSAISHLLYADDTQLFVSFTPKNFPSVISDLQSTISLISSWISSNCLTLNPSKMNFFSLASLNKHPQLSTLRSLYTMRSLSHPLPLPKISVSSSTQLFPFLSRSHPFQVPVTTIYVIFGASATL